MVANPEDVLAAASRALDADAFSGVVRVDLAGATVLERACGWADRAHRVPMAIDTRIGVASGGKAFTALTVMALVERGDLSLDTTARSLLGDDLPLIDDRVTVRHLLAHRSGIGDYFDESVFDDVTQPVMPVPVHRLATTEDFLVVLDGHPQVSVPGERFAYNNGGYVVLALLAERAAGVAYDRLVDELVVAPAGLTATALLRTDSLPGDAAIGYLFDDGLRSNVLDLPVRASGDGGIFTTAADVHRLWHAFVGGRIVSPASVALMTTVHSPDTGDDRPYGLGFWLDAVDDTIVLVGSDAGQSFWSAHRPSDGTTIAVLSNTTEGAWPVARILRSLVGGAPA